MIKQTIGFLALCLTLFGCQKPQPEVYVKTIIIYRDTCDSEFIRKIGQIESGGLDSISGENGRGIGRYGIYEIAVIGSGMAALLNYSHSDMYRKEASERVFWAMMGVFCHLHWQKYGQPPTYEELARKWSGGPNGENKDATLKYLKKFRNE
jgi:hypothetical protein